jgi:DNA recombination protein RmuC
MTDVLLLLVLILEGVALVVLFTRKSVNSDPRMSDKLTEVLVITDRIEKTLKQELAQNRLELSQSQKDARKELSEAIMGIRQDVERRLELIGRNNTDQLEKMRNTVDEKLTETLDKRLGEKFKLVSNQLDLVSKGLGEMQGLASGVGDLKKVLTNVKTRGTWGEVQLQNLLDQILTKEQYVKNAATREGSNDRVEFAIKFAGRDKDSGPLLLPIDAKFPIEDYQKLITAEEKGDLELAKVLAKSLETRIKNEAKDINSKYISPPATTDFAILYLPIEGLYAEVSQNPGLTEELQNNYRVIVAGPSIIWAILNALQMGFKTLAIEKRSSEVWKLLTLIKGEFGKFGDMLDKTHKKLEEASKELDTASSKTRSITRKLDRVEDLPAPQVSEPPALLP